MSVFSTPGLVGRTGVCLRDAISLIDKDMPNHLSRQDLVRFAWGHQGELTDFDPKPLFAEIKACAGAEARHLSRALPRLWKHLDHPGHDGLRFARATALTAETFESLMGILSTGRAQTLLDYRFPASPAAMLFVALAVGRFSLRYHGGTLAAKPEDFWYPPHISLAFARVWPNHLGLEFYEGLVDSLMNVPSPGLWDSITSFVGRIEPPSYGATVDTMAAVDRGGQTSGRERDDKAEILLRKVREELALPNDRRAIEVFARPSAEEVRNATSILAEATGWEGASDARPRMSSSTPDPQITLRSLAAILTVAASLRREAGVFPGHPWSRAKLVMAMASSWPAMLDIGLFDQLMEQIYGRADFSDLDTVGMI
jgi:hypothetical protein